MLDGVNGLLNLTTVGGLELGRAADIVTDGLTAMGLSAKDTDRFVDVLAATITNANTDVEGFGEALKYVGPVAGSLGIELEDLSLAIGLMANSGIKGSQAGTTLRSGLVNLIKPSKEASNAMEKYGIEVKKGTDGNVDLGATMLHLRERFATMTTEQKSQAAAAIFGKTAMAGWLAVVNSSEEDMKLLTDAINGSKDAAQKLAEKFDNTAEGSMLKMQSALEALKIRGFEILEPAIVEVYKTLDKFFTLCSQDKPFDALNSVSEKVSQWSKKIPEAIKFVSDAFGKFVVESLPKMLQAGTDILDNLLKGITQNKDKIQSSISNAVGQIASWVSSNMGTIGEIGKTILRFITKAFTDNKPEIQSAVGKFVSVATEIKGEYSLMAFNMGAQLAPAFISGWIDGTIRNIPQFLGTALNTITLGFGDIAVSAVKNFFTMFKKETNESTVNSAYKALGIDPSIAENKGKDAGEAANKGFNAGLNSNNQNGGDGKKSYYKALGIDPEFAETQGKQTGEAIDKGVKSELEKRVESNDQRKKYYKALGIDPDFARLEGISTGESASGGIISGLFEKLNSSKNKEDIYNALGIESQFARSKGKDAGESVANGVGDATPVMETKMRDLFYNSLDNNEPNLLEKISSFMKKFFKKAEDETVTATPAMETKMHDMFYNSIDNNEPTLIEKIKGFAKKWLKSADDEFDTHGDVMNQKAHDLFYNSIDNNEGNLVEKMKGFVRKWLYGAKEQADTSVSEISPQIDTKMRELFEIPEETKENAFTKMKDFIKNWLGKGKEEIETNEELEYGMDGKLKKVETVFDKHMPQFAKNGELIMENTKNGVITTGPGLVDETGKISVDAMEEFNKNFGTLDKVSKQAMIDAANAITQAASDMEAATSASFSKVRDVATEKYISMKKVISTQMGEIRTVVVEKSISIKNVMTTQFSEMRNTITEKMISAKKVVSTQMGEMTSHGQDKIRALSNTVQGCMNTIKTSLNISTQVNKVISDFNKLSTALSKKVTANIQINKSVSTLSAPMLNIPDVYSSAPNLNNVPSLQYDNSQSHTGSSRRSNGNQHMDIYLSIDGASFAKATTKYTNKETARIDLRKARLAGGF